MLREGSRYKVRGAWGARVLLEGFECSFYAYRFVKFGKL
jgi:hypothetical protein